jgi:hypothetical protein
MMEKLAQAGEGGGGGAHPPHFTIFTITYKVAVCAPAERADTLTLFPFHLYPSTLWVEHGIEQPLTRQTH